jgi:hypothetical protein
MVDKFVIFFGFNLIKLSHCEQNVRAMVCQLGRTERRYDQSFEALADTHPPEGAVLTALVTALGLTKRHNLRSRMSLSKRRYQIISCWSALDRESMMVKSCSVLWEAPSL